jgi:hypothetical protein
MQLEEKKQVEVLLMEYFRQTYPEFPKGRLVPSESPDFILGLKARISVGIEITRLYPSDQKSILLPPEDSSFEMKFINKVKELIEGYISQPLFVKFLFIKGHSINDSHILSAAIMTSVAIRKALYQKKADFSHEIIGHSHLPSFLKSVLVMRHSLQTISLWEKANHQGISNDIAADLRNAIQKKDDKLEIYKSRNLQYYWLLITTDQLESIRNVNIGNQIGKQEFNSLFHKVFLFELMKARVFQLV